MTTQHEASTQFTTLEALGATSIGAAASQPGSIVLKAQDATETLRLDPTGMTYKGQRIEDAGEAHRALMEVLQSSAAPAGRAALPDLGSTVVNEASWRFVRAMPHQIPAPIWNDLKPAVYAALAYYHAALSGSQRPAEPQHPDNEAADRFAVAMKAKLAAARAKGRSGWDDPDQCSTQNLSNLLHEHVGKGDPVDVANFCMMLHERGSGVLPAPQTDALDAERWRDLMELCGYWQDGSAETVKLLQDDATRDCIIAVGNDRPGRPAKRYTGGSFAGALAQARREGATEEVKNG